MSDVHETNLHHVCWKWSKSLHLAAKVYVMGMASCVANLPSKYRLISET